MKAGRLDRRVTLQSVAYVQDSVGEPIPTWSTVRQLWAEKESEAVKRRFAGDQRFAEADAVWRIRWYPNATAIAPDTHRIVYRSREYDILGTVEIGRREGLHIVTKARADSGDGGP